MDLKNIVEVNTAEIIENILQIKVQLFVNFSDIRMRTGGRNAEPASSATLSENLTKRRKFSIT